MRVAIPAIVMVSLFAAACSGNPKPPPLVEVSPALSPDAPPPAVSAAPTAQSPYQADLEAWCNAPASAPGAAKASKEDRPKIVAEWLSAHLKSDQAKDLAHNMGAIDPGKRKEAFRKEVEGQGIKSCPFLDEMH
jgi:hypothetical protein